MTRRVNKLVLPNTADASDWSAKITVTEGERVRLLAWCSRFSNNDSVMGNAGISTTFDDGDGVLLVIGGAQVAAGESYTGAMRGGVFKTDVQAVEEGLYGPLPEMWWTKSVTIAARTKQIDSWNYADICVFYEIESP